jgi:hypothetical protein
MKKIFLLGLLAFLVAVSFTSCDKPVVTPEGSSLTVYSISSIDRDIKIDSLNYGIYCNEVFIRDTTINDLSNNSICKSNVETKIKISIDSIMNPFKIISYTSENLPEQISLNINIKNIPETELIDTLIIFNQISLEKTNNTIIQTFLGTVKYRIEIFNSQFPSSKENIYDYYYNNETLIFKVIYNINPTE